MPFTTSFDSARKIIFLNQPGAGASVAVSVAPGKLVFVSKPVTGPEERSELSVGFFAGFYVYDNVTLYLDAATANGKAIYGGGKAITLAKAAGEDLSAFSLSTDVIQLSDGSSYTLTVAQALISRFGGTGAVADLRSTNGNSKMTLMAVTGADISEIQLDKNDTLVLGVGQGYTLTADQAMVGKVGAGAVGDFSTSGALLIKAAKDADLSGLKFKPTDVLELGAGEDYVLNSAQLAVARVGSNGVMGSLGNAGAVTVKANASVGEDLSLIKATGIDIYELAAGKAYTLTADQLSVARVGVSGLAGDTKGAGVVTVKVGTVSDITKLITKASDVLILNANAPYLLTTEQAKIAKVGTLATAKPGDLSAAGQITVVAGLNNLGNNASRAEDLSVFAAKGVDFYELAAGADYVLTSAQAKVAKVGAGALGNLTAAGNITLIAQIGENLSQTPIIGADEYRLTAGQTYTLTAEQALKARVLPNANGVLGNYGDLANTKTTVLAGSVNDLTPIGIDANDAFLLTANQNYKLTALQASVSRIDDGLAGSLAKAGRVVIKANPKGEDLAIALLKVTGYDVIELNAGSKYALTSAQAELAQVSAGLGNNPAPVVGNLSLAGAILLVANDMGEDLSGLTVQGIKAVQLTTGKDYTLTASQALMASIGATGPLGDLTWMPTPLTAGAKTGVMTVLAAENNVDFTKIKTDGNDVLVLKAGNHYKLGVGQALSAKLGSDGALGQLVSSGRITVVADASNTDLSKLILDSGDLIELAGGLNYTLATHHLPLVRMGGINSLTKAGAVTVVASNAGEDLTEFNTPGIDAFVLNPAAKYSLRVDQAKIARVGASGTLGDLTAMTGEINLWVPDSVSASLDLTAVVLKDSDNLQLRIGSNYILTAKQAAMASVIAGTEVGPRGDLSGAGYITVRPAPGSDLTVLLAGVQGINRIELDPEGLYTLSDAQARMAVLGKSELWGDLASKSANSKLTLVAGDTADLADIQIDSNDKIILKSNKTYTLTAEQAAVSQFVGATTTVGGVLANPLDDLSIIRVLAPKGADLSKLVLDGNDFLELGVGQRYTLTSALAKQSFINGSVLGDLSAAGAVRIVAAPTGEDISSLSIDVNDTLQLTLGVNYTLTAVQAANAVMGPTGVKGKLTGAGVLTVKAGTTQDLMALALDTTGLATLVDVIQLDANQNYSLTTTQAGIARVGSVGLQGQLQDAGILTINAGVSGEDLSLVKLSGLDSSDRIVLTKAKNYTLTKDQLALAMVGSGLKGDLTSAGIITLKSAPSGVTEDLSTVSGILGVDSVVLKNGVNSTLTDEQAMVAQLGTGKVRDLRGTEILTLKSNDREADLAPITTDNNDLIWLSSGFNYSLNSQQVPRVSFDGQNLASFAAVSGQITLKASNLGEDLSSVNASMVDVIHLTAGRNYTLTPEQAQMATLGTGLAVQNTTVSYSGNASLSGLTSGTHNYTTQVRLDTTKFINGGTITMQVVLGNGTSAASYDLYKNQITIGSNNRPLNSLKNAYDVSPGTTTNLTYQFQPSSTNTYVFGVEGSWFSPVSATNTVSYSINITGSTYVTDLTKAGVITIKANPDGDNGLKSKLSFIQGLDVIALADAKDYTLSASQALLARVGSATTSGVLTSTGVITVDDRDSAIGLNMNLTRLVLDNADVLLLGGGNYDLTSSQVRKAASTMASAGTVNLWASSMGEDLSGISAAALDNIYLTASRDYILGLDQVAKSKVGATGASRDLTKAGKVTLKLRDGESTAALSSNPAVKGVDILQVIAADTASNGIQFTLTGGLSKQLQVSMTDGAALLTFSKNTSSSASGGGNTGSDGILNDKGEWSFVNNTDVFKFWDGSSIQTITLVGVSSIAADGSTLLIIGY